MIEGEMRSSLLDRQVLLWRVLNNFPTVCNTIKKLNKMATRWGICGAGGISFDFVSTLTSRPSTEHQAVAVAARQLDRAQAFAKELNIPQAYGSYEELAKDPNVDVVYIGTIHPGHYSQTLLFLNSGKHVLVEKPAAMNLKQLKEMTSLAKEKKLFFMEAVWSRFFPVYKKAIEELSNGTIGQLKVLKAEFCIPISEVPRIKQKALGGGAMLDIGVYPINITTFLFGYPDSVTIEGNLTNTDVDESACIIFKYKDGRMAQLLYNTAFQGNNEVFVYGTKGEIKINSPMWCPTEMTLPSGKVTFDLPKTEATFKHLNSAGMVYEAMHVRECLQKGLTESPLLPPSHSETVMGILDEMRKKIGLRYDVD